MSGYSRRDFLKTGIAAGTLASVSPLPLHAEKRTAFDKVTLGKSGIEVTRLAFGTGSANGHVQAALGQKEFSKLIAYAYERGIRFFETAESYVTPAMLGEALKPFPRDSYVLMNKVTTDTGVDPHQRFEEMLRTSKTEYFDIMLLHWQHTAGWVDETKHWQEGIEKCQAMKTILSRGASVHGLPALRQMPGNPWLQVAMIRMNHKAGEEGRHGRNQHEAGGRWNLHAPRRPRGRHALRHAERRRGLRDRGLQEQQGSG
jgi:hypothetical protein